MSMMKPVRIGEPGLQSGQIREVDNSSRRVKKPYIAPSLQEYGKLPDHDPRAAAFRDVLSRQSERTKRSAS